MGLQAPAARNDVTIPGRSEVIQTLDYLGRELSGLDRLVIATEEIIKILNTDWPLYDAEIQEKVILSMQSEIE